MGQNLLGAGIHMSISGNMGTRLQHVLNYLTRVNEQIDKIPVGFDNSSASLMQFYKNFQLLMSLQVGQGLLSMGRGIAYTGERALRSMASFGKQAFDTAGEFESYKMQLATLFQEDRDFMPKTEEDIANIRRLARDTIFTVDELIRATVGFRARGIDPFEKFQVGDTGIEQELLLFAGDLAGMMDKTVGDAMWSLKEAAAGSWISFMRRFDTGKDQVEDRLSQVMGEAVEISSDKSEAGMRDRIEKLMQYIGIMYGGGMERLAQTTGGIMARLTDAWQLFKLEVGDAGLLQAGRQTLANLYSVIRRFQEDGSLDRFARLLGSVFTSMWSVADAGLEIFDTLFERITSLTDSSPTLAKILLILPAVASLATISAGKLLSMASGILTAISMMVLLNQHLVMMNIMTGSSATLLTTVGRLFWWLASRVTITTLALGLLYTAWRSNFLGMRDRVAQWGRQVRMVFDDVKYMANAKDIEEYKKAWQEWGVLSSASKEVIRLLLVAEGLAQFLSTGKIHESIVDRLGITGMTDVFVTLALVKYRIESLFEGIVEGYGAIRVIVGPILRTIGAVLQWVANILVNITGSSIRELSEASDEGAKALGRLVGAGIALFSFIKIVRVIGGLVGGLASLGKNARNSETLLGRLFGFAYKHLSNLLAGPLLRLMYFMDAIKAKLLHLGTVVVQKSLSGAIRLWTFIARTAIPWVYRAVTTQLIPVLARATAAMWGFLIANPYILAITAVIAALVAVVVLLWKNWDKVTESYERYKKAFEEGGVLGLFKEFRVQRKEVIEQGFSTQREDGTNKTWWERFYGNLTAYMIKGHNIISASLFALGKTIRDKEEREPEETRSPFVSPEGDLIINPFILDRMKQRLAPEESYAQGGWITSPHVGLVGEDGPEVIIPVTKPERAERLWTEAGRYLGLLGNRESNIPTIGPISPSIENNIFPEFNIPGTNNIFPSYSSVTNVSNLFDNSITNVLPGIAPHMDDIPEQRPTSRIEEPVTVRSTSTTTTNTRTREQTSFSIGEINLSLEFPNVTDSKSLKDLNKRDLRKLADQIISQLKRKHTEEALKNYTE